MHERRKAREAALQALYQAEMADGETAEVLASVTEKFRLTPEALKYCEAVVFGVTDNIEEIDRLIEEYSEKWALKRMPVVDRNVLRVGVYELRHCPDTPYKVVIDEAVELAKRYGSEESGAFVNGILDHAAKEAASKKAV
ncbi:MAG: transcription antitermination factor NusB [Thermodesulfobacteriota bacterium]